MAAEIHVNDVGTVVRFKIVDEDGAIVPLVDYISLFIIIAKPSGAILERVGVLTTDGTDGKLKYVTVAGDFTEAGAFRFQAVVELPDGLWHTNIKKKKVLANLE